MDKKEQWANETLKSLDGLKKAKPSDALFNQILKKLPTNETATIPLKRLAWVAAAACVLIAINVISLQLDKTEFQQESNELLSNYHIYTS